MSQFMDWPVRVHHSGHHWMFRRQQKKQQTILTSYEVNSSDIFRMRTKLLHKGVSPLAVCLQQLLSTSASRAAVCRSVGPSGFLAMTHSRWLTPDPMEAASFSYAVSELTIIVMPGCKCQRISVSSALLGSVCQHLIDVSACKQSRRPHMRIFTHACTWKKPRVAQ